MFSPTTGLIAFRALDVLSDADDDVIVFVFLRDNNRFTRLRGGMTNNNNTVGVRANGLSRVRNVTNTTRARAFSG